MPRRRKSQKPPPLPNRLRGLGVYLRTGVWLLPALVVWFFAHLILLPKLGQLWQDTGLTGSKAQWLMDISHGFHDHFYYVFAGASVLLVIFEFRWRAWPRYRSAVMAVATFLVNLAVLVFLTTIATASLLAAPLLLKHK